jgi:Ca-activated chloride channel family protein
MPPLADKSRLISVRRHLVPFALLTIAAALHGQAPIERPELPTLQVSTRLVTLAVNAVDSHGAPVGGLEQKSFRILEDGKPQNIRFFDRESATPLSIVLAVDGSESVLRNESLEKKAAERFVKTVVRPAPPSGVGDELDLMEFADDVTEVVSFTSDRKRIADGFDRLHRGDATALYDCVFLASRRLGETSRANGRRRVLVLVTDGGDTVHGTHYDEAIEQAQRAGVTIYSLIVIPIYADAGRNTGGEHALIQMAEDTGGKYFYVADAKDLGPALEKVSEDLRTQYVLGYYAPEPTKKSRVDGFRTLHIDLTDPAQASSITLRYRTGYYSNK